MKEAGDVSGSKVCQRHPQRLDVETALGSAVAIERRLLQLAEVERGGTEIRELAVAPSR
jgi:hypothetical protein